MSFMTKNQMTIKVCGAFGRKKSRPLQSSSCDTVGTPCNTEISHESSNEKISINLGGSLETRSVGVNLCSLLCINKYICIHTHTQSYTRTQIEYICYLFIYRDENVYVCVRCKHVNSCNASVFRRYGRVATPHVQTLVPEWGRSTR